MTSDFIDSAIQRHTHWIARFKAELEVLGKGHLDEEVDIVKDETACALGQWLSLDKACETLGTDFLSRTVAIHGTFHEVAGELLLSLRRKDPPEVTHELLASLENLSKSLIELLKFAKKQQSSSASSLN